MNLNSVTLLLSIH